MIRVSLLFWAAIAAEILYDLLGYKYMVFFLQKLRRVESIMKLFLNASFFTQQEKRKQRQRKERKLVSSVLFCYIGTIDNYKHHSLYA